MKLKPPGASIRLHVAGTPETMKTRKIAVTVISLSILMVLIVFSPIHTVWAGEKIVMVTPLPNTEVLGKWVELIFSEAFRRLDLEMEYRQYPPKRCGEMANTGAVDGELGRPYGYDALYPNLVRVEEPSMSTYYAAYVTDPDIQLEGWESLKGTNYKVEHLRGAALSTQKLPEVVKPDNLSEINEVTQGLKKLRAGRTDVFVIAANMVDPLLATDTSYSTIRKAGIMAEVHMYPYLHKKHKDLAPKLAAALKEIKELNS